MRLIQLLEAWADDTTKKYQTLKKPTGSNARKLNPKDFKIGPDGTLIQITPTDELRSKPITFKPRKNTGRVNNSDPTAIEKDSGNETLTLIKKGLVNSYLILYHTLCMDDLKLKTKRNLKAHENDLIKKQYMDKINFHNSLVDRLKKSSLFHEDFNNFLLNEWEKHPKSSIWKANGIPDDEHQIKPPKSNDPNAKEFHYLKTLDAWFNNNFKNYQIHFLTEYNNKNSNLKTNKNGIPERFTHHKDLLTRLKRIKDAYDNEDYDLDDAILMIMDIKKDDVDAMSEEEANIYLNA